ncbi:MAG TPA: YtxH domain-containing protein [Anaeromyxobacteraceae bacterium]|nr:YtxH domain-containing protein [Anaeromyxobacteraceae bacterium]
MNEEVRTGRGLGSVLLAFLGGAVVGGVTALLLAPRSGEQTRKRIVDMAEEGKHKAERVPVAVREATQAATEAFERAMKQPPV